MSDEHDPRITVWGLPGEQVKGSCWGTVTWDAWCLMEIARVRKLGVTLRVITNKFGAIALSR
jgi:hypothetical protein